MQRSTLFPKRSLLPGAAALLGLFLLLALRAGPAAAVDVTPTGPPEILSAGYAHTCALTPAGAVDCWGWNSYGQAADQAGPYTQVSAGDYHTCALTPAGAADCWGLNTSSQAADQPGPYTQVSAGGSHTCALTPAGAVDCWGYNFFGQAADQPGPYIQVSSGGYHTCALTPAGAVDCWGYNGSGQATDQTGPYTQVSAGSNHTCALTPAGAVECWGRDDYGQATDQPGPYGPYVPANHVFMSAKAAGTTGDGLAFRSDDILKWDGVEWTKWFDGQAAGLVPSLDKHNINAFWIPDPGGEEVILSFAQNRWTVPGIPGWVDGMDLVRWDGGAFSLYFDGSDVGLTVKVAEKIDGLHILPGSESPIGGGSCLAYLLVSTQAAGRVPNHSGGTLNFRGEDVLGFCATSLGETTAGLWHKVLDGSDEGLPINAIDSISVSDDGQTMVLTTRKVISIPADGVAGGHSMVYSYDFGTQAFSGPHFKAADNGLPRPVDALQVAGDLP